MTTVRRILLAVCGLSFLLGMTVIPSTAQTITSFTPDSGAGGTQITIIGTDFTGATSLTIGGKPVHRFWVSSATIIGAVVGTGTTGPVEVRTTTGIATSGTNFTVTGPGVFGPIATSASLVLGQFTFVHSTVGNTDQLRAAGFLNTPVGVAIDPTTGKVFIADAGNHRVLRYPSVSALYNGIAPEAVLGQANLNDGGVNRTGVGTVGPGTLHFPRGLAFDHEGRLWVADGENHRVLRFDNASSKPNGASADGVLGQPDLFTAQRNRGNGANPPVPDGFSFPSNLTVDAGGRLWVVDVSNHRIVRFDNPAAKANGAPADGVLGALDLSTPRNSPWLQNRLDNPYGIVVDALGRLWVSEASNDRVVRFDNAALKPANANADALYGKGSYTDPNPSPNPPTLSSLMQPRSVFYDGADRLWVSDQGNRIVRFDDVSLKPTTGATADARIPTGGTGVTDSTLNFPELSMFIDDSGRLWVVDRGHNRIVVRSPIIPPSPTVSVLTFTPESGAGGTVVTITGTNFTGATSVTIGGQPVHSFWVNSPTSITAIAGTGMTGVVQVRTPIGIGTSVMTFTVTGPGVFQVPSGTAARVLGQTDFVSAAAAVADPLLSGGGLREPFSVAVDPTTGKVFVSDNANNRVLRFASFEALNNGSAPEAAFGQPNTSSLWANNGGRSAATMNLPTGIHVDGSGRLWVADADNHRVLRFDNASNRASGAAADGFLGQADEFSGSFNRGGSPFDVDSLTMYSPYSVFVDGGGRLWVSDRFSHRVLRFDDAANKPNGAAADGVLGQATFNGFLSNSPTRSASTFFRPTGVYVDGGGRLWVAEESNHRILRFDNAANKPNGAPADGVLGQSGFTTGAANSPALSASTFNIPLGISVDGAGRLWVADLLNNRILRFDNAAAKADGAAADGVIGQSDFSSSGANAGGRSASSLNFPYDVFVGGDGRLWGVEFNNNRVMAYIPPPVLTAVSPNIVTASNGTITITISGLYMQNATSLTITSLDANGIPIGTVNILPFTSGTTPATSLTIELPAGTIATGGTLTIVLGNAQGTGSVDLLVQSDNIIVTNAENDGGGSLRRAFTLTNPGGTIQIQADVNFSNLTGGPITIDKPVTLVGPDGGFTINGNGTPVFIIGCGGNLQLENVNVRNAANVPAIQNDCGNIRLRRVNVSQN